MIPVITSDIWRNILEYRVNLVKWKDDISRWQVEKEVSN